MNSSEKNSLEKMISKKTIALNVEVKDWQEAVRVSGELLVKNDFVEPRYIDAMIETTKTLGPYIVISPGVALPHARPEDGVKEPCMSLITLKTPVNFGNEHNDPVKLVIAFGTVDHNAHVKAISKLARIIGDEEKLNTLINAQEVAEVEKIVSGN
jgi:mannitol/fructose-specific phosphotransferase system IIA component (Ntr-type)